MKKSIWFVLALAAAVSVGGLLTLRAADGAGAPARRPAGGKHSWASSKEKLGLTDAQIVAIKDELRAEKGARIELSRQRHDAKVMRGGEFLPKLGTVLDQTNADIAAVLTPEQRNKFEKIQAENKAFWSPR